MNLSKFAFIFILLISAGAPAADQCAALFKTSVQDPVASAADDNPKQVIKIDVKKVKPEEVLNSIPEIEWKNRAGLHSTLQRLAQSMSVSDAEFDNWMKMFGDTGMVRGTIHIHSLFASARDSNISKENAFKDEGEDFSRATLKRDFKRFLNPRVDGSLLNKRAIEMAEISIGLKVAKSPFSDETSPQYRESDTDRSGNNLRRAPLHNEVINLAGKELSENTKKMEILLAAIYRSTIQETMRASIKASPWQIKEIFLGEKALHLSGVGGILGGAMTGILSFGGTELGMIHDPLLFFGVAAAGVLTGSTHYVAGKKFVNGKAEKFLSKFRKKPIEIPKFETDESTFVVRALNEFNPEEAFSSFTIPLRAQLEKESLFTELTTLQNPREIRIAVDQAHRAVKLAMDTLYVQLRRTKQISQTIDKLTMFGSSRSNLNDVSRVKLDSVISNLRTYLERLNDDSDYTLEVCDSLDVMLSSVNESEVVRDNQYRQIREDAKYLSEHLNDKTRQYKAELDQAFANADQKLSALQRAYLQSPNFVDETLKSIRK